MHICKKVKECSQIEGMTLVGGIVVQVGGITEGLTSISANPMDL